MFCYLNPMVLHIFPMFLRIQSLTPGHHIRRRPHGSSFAAASRERARQSKATSAAACALEEDTFFFVGRNTGGANIQTKTKLKIKNYMYKYVNNDYSGLAIIL